MPKAWPEKTYQFLTGDEDARVCKDIPDEACHEQPRNYLIHVASLSLTKIGDKLIDPKITLAWLLTALGAPQAYLSLLVPIHNAFSLLPQLLIAGYLRRLPVRKWLWSLGAVGQAAAIAGIALAAMNLEGQPAGLVIIGALLWFSLSRGISSVAYKDVLGKTISKTRRGSVSGYADGVAGLFAILLSLWLIFGGERDIATVAAILISAACCWLGAALVFTSLQESHGATSGGANAIREALLQLSVLRKDRKFRLFVLVRTLLLGTALLPPYLITLLPATEQRSLTELGLLLLAAGIAGFISAPLWGKLSDRSSRLVMAAGGSLVALTGGLAATAYFFTEPGGLIIALSLFVVYVGHAGVRIGRKTHLVDMANSDNRATFVAVSNTVIGIALLLFAGLGAVVNSFMQMGGLLFFGLMAMCGAILAVRLEELQSS